MKFLVFWFAIAIASPAPSPADVDHSVVPTPLTMPLEPQSKTKNPFDNPFEGGPGPVVINPSKRKKTTSDCTSATTQEEEDTRRLTILPIGPPTGIITIETDPSKPQ